MIDWHQGDPTESRKTLAALLEARGRCQAFSWFLDDLPADAERRRERDRTSGADPAAIAAALAHIDVIERQREMQAKAGLRAAIIDWNEAVDANAEAERLYQRLPVPPP